ncbi:MAG: hypothetical protein QXN86_01500 [Candidatus Methanomethylicaceae archaeon]
MNYPSLSQGASCFNDEACWYFHQYRLHLGRRLRVVPTPHLYSTSGNPVP